VTVIRGNLERGLAMAVAKCRIRGVVEQQPRHLGTAAPGGFVQRAGLTVRLVRQARVFHEALLDQGGKSPTGRRADAEHSRRAMEAVVARGRISAGLLQELDDASRTTEVSPV